MSKNDEDDLFTWSAKTSSIDGDIPTWDDEPVVDTKLKLDIFDVLRRADLGDRDFYTNLKPDLQKQFAPIVVMRWFSSPLDQSQYRDYLICMTNEMLNIDFWSIQKHPELIWKILTLCGTGKSIKRNWVPMPKRLRQISKVDEFMLQWYPSANSDELGLLTRNLTREEFEQFVKSTGCSDQELKETLGHFDAERGTKPEKAKKQEGSKKRKGS